MRFVFALALVLSAAGARAEDPRDIATCSGADPQLTRYLFSESELPAAAPGVVGARLILRQEPEVSAPTFSIRLEAIKENGASATTPVVIRRVAYVESATGRAAASYSPTRSTGRQGARPFSLLIDASGSAKLSFIQIGARGAPVAPFDLDCQRLDRELMQPGATSLEGHSATGKIAILERLERTLPTRTAYRSSSDEPARDPAGAWLGALAALQAKIQSLTIEPADVAKRTYGARNRVIEVAPGAARCATIAWNHFKPIRDFSGATVAYRVGVECGEVAAVETTPRAGGEPEVERQQITYSNVLVTPTEVLYPARADYGFRTLRQR